MLNDRMVTVPFELFRDGHMGYKALGVAIVILLSFNVAAEAPDASSTSPAKAILSAIQADKTIQGYSLTVESSDSRVVLKGRVLDESSIAPIVAHAERISGTRKVVSELVARPPTDEEMEMAAYAALNRAGLNRPAGDRMQLTVTVEKGIAYLRGTAETPAQIDMGLSAALTVFGIKDVLNYATIPEYPAPRVHIGIPR